LLPSTLLFFMQHAISVQLLWETPLFVTVFCLVFTFALFLLAKSDLIDVTNDDKSMPDVHKSTGSKKKKKKRKASILYDAPSNLQTAAALKLNDGCQCGSSEIETSRNLVVCIDGTANQFSEKVRTFSMIIENITLFIRTRMSSNFLVGLLRTINSLRTIAAESGHT
jgi:hypothetical protein